MAFGSTCLSLIRTEGLKYVNATGQWRLEAKIFRGIYTLKLPRCTRMRDRIGVRTEIMDLSTRGRVRNKRRRRSTGPNRSRWEALFLIRAFSLRSWPTVTWPSQSLAAVRELMHFTVSHPGIPLHFVLTVRRAHLPFMVSRLAIPFDFMSTARRARCDRLLRNPAKSGSAGAERRSRLLRSRMILSKAKK